MRKILLAATAFSLAVPAVTVPADAQYRRYHGRDTYSQCQRSGTTGTILGAAAGALLGRHVEREVIRPRRYC